MTMLFQALKNNTNVKKVECTQNMFGKKGAEALIDCLYHNRTITTFYTYSSDIPKNLETTISELVSNNSKGIKNTIPADHQSPEAVPLPSSLVVPKQSTTTSKPTPVSSDLSNVLSRLKVLEEKEQNGEKEITNLKKQIGELEKKRKE